MKDNTYLAYHIDTHDEVVMALLSIYSFESFEEIDKGLIGYISKANHTIEEEEINELLNKREIDFYIEEIKQRNWNEEWEKSFKPVIIEDFCCIRADFHDPVPDCKYDIIINPKMAFGTGHHETTYMVSKAMREIDFGGKQVFDYGCGTGILSILASKLGAEHIDAIDIEEESYLNTLENAEINKIANINAMEATLDNFPAKKYDIILANINRNVLLDSASELYNRLHADGVLLISGILKDDLQLVNDKYVDNGFEQQAILDKGNWLCIKYSAE